MPHRPKAVMFQQQKQEQQSMSSSNNMMDDGSQGGFGYDKGNKRYRRMASEIDRRFVCWCGKAYGSEGSLN